MKTNKYLTFPISLLEQGFIDIRQVCDSIMKYSFYALFRSMSCYRPDIDLSKITEFDLEAVERAANILWIEFPSPKDALLKGQKLYNETRGQPMTSISTRIIFQFYEESKTEHDIACFLAFCGIKSIIGKKTYCKTNKAFVHARMFGSKSRECLENKKLDPNENEFKLKYEKRFHMDKVLTTLELYWHLKRYSQQSRGLYLSFSLSLEKLIYEVESKKRQRKELSLKQQKDAIKERVMRKMNNSSLNKKSSNNYDITTALRAI